MKCFKYNGKSKTTHTKNTGIEIPFFYEWTCVEKSGGEINAKTVILSRVAENGLYW